MSDGKDTPWEQAAAFQKIWSETFSNMTQGAFQFSPDSAPPEFMRQMRSSMFQALGKTWEEFMRSPEFLSSMIILFDFVRSLRQSLVPPSWRRLLHRRCKVY